VFRLRFSTTLRARLDVFFRQSLECARLFEAPMPSLFHLEAPVVERNSDRQTVYRSPPTRVDVIADEFDIDAMIERFRARARAVRQRTLPPVEGADRKRFVDQARIDFQDYAIIGDASGKIEDGILTLTVDLRPKPDDSGPAVGSPGPPVTT
jgi:hypothetical protein